MFIEAATLNYDVSRIGEKNCIRRENVSKN
jgi:hypothetical protein